LDSQLIMFLQMQTATEETNSARLTTKFLHAQKIKLRTHLECAACSTAFFFSSGTSWTSLTEVRINDKYSKSAGNIDVVLVRTAYTRFDTALDKITRAEAGDIENFINHLQEKLDAKLESGHSPDAPTLSDVFNREGI